MKRTVLRKILIMIACFIAIASNAEIPSSPIGLSDYAGKSIVIRVSPRNISKRPKADHDQNIYCVYEDGNLYVSFAIPEGTCALFVTEFATGFTYRYTFDTEEDAVIYIGQVSSAYLEFHTSSGNVYEARID